MLSPQGRPKVQERAEKPRILLFLYQSIKIVKQYEVGEKDHLE